MILRNYARKIAFKHQNFLQSWRRLTLRPQKRLTLRPIWPTSPRSSFTTPVECLAVFVSGSATPWSFPIGQIWRPIRTCSKTRRVRSISSPLSRSAWTKSPESFLSEVSDGLPSASTSPSRSTLQQIRSIGTWLSRRMTSNCSNSSRVRPWRFASSWTLAWLPSTRRPASAFPTTRTTSRRLQPKGGRSGRYSLSNHIFLQGWQEHTALVGLIFY